MKKGTWWERAHRAKERTKGTPAWECYFRADDAFEKAACFRQTHFGQAEAARWHRVGKQKCLEGLRLEMEHL